MAKITGDVPCAACGQMNRVTLTKQRVGEPAPPAEYEILAEASLVGGGLFAGKAPGPFGEDTEDTEEEGE